MQNRFSIRPWRVLWPLLCAALLLGGSGLSRADDDHDRARKALEAGEILSLSTILERVNRDYPGQVFDVELDRDIQSGVEHWVYKVKLLRTGGSLVKLKVNARDGTLISSKSKGEQNGDKVHPKNHPKVDGR